MGESQPGMNTGREPDAVRAARPVRTAGRGNGPAGRPAPRLGPTPTPTCAPGKAGYISRLSWTRSAVASSAGRSPIAELSLSLVPELAVVANVTPFVGQVY